MIRESTDSTRRTDAACANPAFGADLAVCLIRAIAEHTRTIWTTVTKPVSARGKHWARDTARLVGVRLLAISATLTACIHAVVPSVALNTARSVSVRILTIWTRNATQTVS